MRFRFRVPNAELEIQGHTGEGFYALPNLYSRKTIVREGLSALPISFNRLSLDLPLIFQRRDICKELLKGQNWNPGRL
ncbi:MAG: hypothetical protein NTV01_05780 [Bacteroidia bacterium]|nr:hypothetical protein [Bacteroidia bacterium]